MQKIIILDFGSQTTQLIGRRVRELDTFCEILPYNKFPHDDPDVIGVILSGSPLSVYADDAFHVDLSNIRGRYPILGICYGAQYMSHIYGGKVESAGTREYGRQNLQYVDTECPLFAGFEPNSQVWMSHGDSITRIPEGAHVVASTETVRNAAYYIPTQDGCPVFGTQFHPEVFHSLQGTLLLKNFVVDVCGSRQEWSSEAFVESTVRELKETIGSDRVILGLSGGVDSSVVAVLLNKAIGRQLTCIFVDHGMLRKNEFADVMKDYECLGLNVIGVDASEKFLGDLAGVKEPEKKPDFKNDAKLVKAPPMRQTGKATAADKPMTEAEYRKFLEQGYKIGARNQLAPNEESRCVSLVAAALKRHWVEEFHWTEGLQSVYLELTFGPGGSLRSYRIVRSSGDTQVDSSVLAAAKATGSVPGLTPDFVRKYSGTPFVIEMKPVRH